MCIGIPMRVLEASGTLAICVSDGAENRQEVDISLVEAVSPGDWLLVFLGAARRVLEADEALRISDALRAMAMAAEGGTVEAGLFADLEQGEPRLPPHLEAARKAGASTG